MSVIMVTCFSCGQTLRFEGVLGRGAECPHCLADVRVCKNCEHHDERAYNGCREPMADRIKDRTRANFCEYFRPAASGQGQAASRSPAQLARAKLEALFGVGGDGPQAQGAGGDSAGGQDPEDA